MCAGRALLTWSRRWTPRTRAELLPQIINLLGKISKISSFFFWSASSDERRRKTAKIGDFNSKLVGICGLEPQTSSLSVTRSNQLSYIPMMAWWSNRDSNPGPPPCKGGALISWAITPVTHILYDFYQKSNREGIKNWTTSQFVIVQRTSSIYHKLNNVNHLLRKIFPQWGKV